MMDDHNHRRSRLEDCVVAAIEPGAKLRRPQESVTQAGTVERTISALDAVLAGQAPALDTIFAQLARQTVEDNILAHYVLRLALKVQSESRAALGTSYRSPDRVPFKALGKNFDEQTDETGNCSA